MSLPNFIFLACQEVAEKFGVGHVANVSNLNPGYIEFLWVELSYVKLGLGFDKSLFLHKVIERSNITFFTPFCTFLRLLFYMVMFFTTSYTNRRACYDSVWLCLTPFDSVWLCLTLYDSVCLCLPLFASVCLCLPLFASVCLCLPLFASVCLF